MKKTTLSYTILFICFFLISCKTVQNNKSNQIRPYIPIDQVLYNKIVSLDKVFFDAYNNCDIAKQSLMYADDIEFFHDKGGLMTSKKEILEATERNICGKVTRKLITGSIEVYPINNYGAVQIGYHKFYNNQEPNAESNPSKFITIWHNENGHWKMAKIVSLH